MSTPFPPRRSTWLGTDSTPESRTRSEDYAVINGVYLAGLAGVAMLCRGPGRADRVPTHELPVVALAAFALSDVVGKQKVSTWLREPFVQEGADHKPIRPEGHGLRFAVGELLMCTRCLGAWSALGLIGLRVAAPGPGRGVTAVLAVAGANHYLQAVFSLVCAAASTAEREP